jgi:nitrogen fixation protein NifU and related proteins
MLTDFLDMNDLYESIILEHARHPQYFGSEQDVLEGFIEADNPMCGDHYKLKLIWSGDLLQNALFYGYGCSISKAAGSILFSKIVGKKKGEIRSILEDFDAVVRGEGSLKPVDPDIMAFIGARTYPSRKACAMLIVDAVKEVHFSQQ